MFEYSSEELNDIVADMKEANNTIYKYLFTKGFGSKCHAFLEFCGLMSKFTDLCRVAAEQGIEFPNANTHSGVAMPVDEHHIRYLAEKFDCIYGPFFKGNPELAWIFAEKALGLKRPR